MTTTTTKRERRDEPLPTFKKKYLNPQEVEEIYGIGQERLSSWRMHNIGPPFKRFGHRIVLYEIGALERWISTLESGGESS